MNLNTKEIEKILENAQISGGVTLSSGIPVHKKFGYQYSKTPNSEVNIAENFTEAECIIRTLNGNCGIWFHDGKIYIETSYWTAKLETALKLGRKYRQLAVYDWKNSRDILVD